MIISNESTDFNDPKEHDDPQLFDDPSYAMIQVFDDPQLFDDPETRNSDCFPDTHVHVYVAPVQGGKVEKGLSICYHGNFYRTKMQS